MNDQDFYDVLDNVKFSLEEKNSLYYKIRDIIISSPSKEDASFSLVNFIENLLSSKIEESKEKIDERKEGNFSSTSGKSLFKRIT